MTTIRAYTTIEQSRKLAEILPIESADMFHFIHIVDTVGFGCKKDAAEFYSKTEFEYIPCWSLAALLQCLPDGTDIIKDKADTENEKYMCTVGVKDDIISTFGNNPVDACMAMIEKLHELKMT